jgi:hypothetical protein
MNLSRNGTARIEYEPLALLSVYRKRMQLLIGVSEALAELGQMHRRGPLAPGEATGLMRARQNSC